MDRIGVQPGDKVTKGQEVGTVGSTGKSTGTHLHYEERHNNTPHAPTFDPSNYRPDSDALTDSRVLDLLYADPDDEDINCVVVDIDVERAAEPTSPQ
jgi:hypothetical protein